MATNNTKKYFDVSKPGKTPASATSRPVIVTNRAIVKDPTLKEEEAEDVRSPLLKTVSKVIAPPKEEVEKTAEEAPKEETQASVTEAPEPEKVEEPAVVPEDEVKNIPDVDDQVDPGRKDEKQAEEVSEAEKAKQDQLDKLVASGKYVVPIGHIKRNRRVRRTLGVAVVLLLLAAVGVFLLIDAGIIKTSITVPIDLIHN